MYTQAEEEQCSRMGMAFPFQGKPAFPIPASEVPPMVVYGPKIKISGPIKMCVTCGRCDGTKKGGCFNGSFSEKNCWCPVGVLWIKDEQPVNPAYSCKKCRKYQGHTPGSCNGGDGVDCFEPTNGMLLVREEAEE
jgi:hypothetical protein